MQGICYRLSGMLAAKRSASGCRIELVFALQFVNYDITVSQGEFRVTSSMREASKSRSGVPVRDQQPLLNLCSGDPCFSTPANSLVQG
jgi:hypothetical protein